MHQQLKIRFEPSLPRGNRRIYIIEELVVPLFLDTPCSNHKDLHEHTPSLGVSSSVDNVKPAIMKWPLDSNFIPAARAKTAMEKEMLNCFLRR
jgi:hypothetical protein